MSGISGGSFDSPRTQPSREVKCQICPWRERRFFGRGILVKPCPECGSRMTFASSMFGDMPVTPDPKLKEVVPFPLMAAEQSGT